jgi:predicted nucleic acid-binding protein
MDALLDTATLIDIYKLYPPAIAWLQANLSSQFGITSTVWMEMMLGATDKADQNRVIRFLNSFQMVFLTQTDQEWALQNLQTYRLSYGIGMNDCLIAAPSHRLQLPIYTRNLKHFTPLLGALAVQAY